MRHPDPANMTKAELDRLGAEAEALTRANTRSLSAADRKALARAASKGGRPRVGSGAQRINITVERGLLKKADEFARRHGMTRSAVLAQGLRRVVA